MHLRHDIPCLRIILASALFALLLGGCSSLPKLARPGNSQSVPSASATVPNGRAPDAGPRLPAAGSGRGGYYQDDGPGEKTPEGLLSTPDAEPRLEPFFGRGNKPYVVFGKTYTPISDNRPFRQRGIGSWYGKKFHGQKTSSGELYDMYRMTAAHPTLPLPSYVRVTNLSNGAKVIVRVNDRGPFHSSRIIDLSYTAAYKLGYIGKGSSELEIERILPDEIENMGRYKSNQPPLLAQAIQGPAPVSMPSPPTATVIAVPEAQAAIGETPEVYAVTPPQIVSSVPEPAAAPTSPPVSRALSPTSPAGFYLQFGAYTQHDNADAAGKRLEENWIGTLPRLTIVEWDSLHRLYSGPFATRDEAAQAVQSAQYAGLPKPLVVERK